MQARFEYKTIEQQIHSRKSDSGAEMRKPVHRRCGRSTTMWPAGVPAEKQLTCGCIEDRKNGIENTMRLTMVSGTVMGTSGSCIKKSKCRTPERRCRVFCTCCQRGKEYIKARRYQRKCYRQDRMAFLYSINAGPEEKSSGRGWCGVISSSETICPGFPPSM